MDKDLQNAIKVLANYAVASDAQKSADGTPTYTQLHGTGGIFSTPGVERDILSAHVRPMGIGRFLPMIPTIDENPRFGALTGYSATTGTRATTPCANAPKAYVKSCMLSARFGLTRFDTEEIDLLAVQRKVNRGDMTDLILRGRVLGLSGLTPAGLRDGNGILNIVTLSEMVIAGVSAERELSQEIWQGTGAYPQFAGLDVQIATGQIDADENVACPALDSDVKDFAYDDVAGGGRSIVTYMSSMEFIIYHIAQRTGALPANWAWVMRPELWEELTAVWPCQYNTNRCSSAMEGDQSQLVIMGESMVAIRDEMRRSMSIEINARRYQVITDDGIYEHNSTNDANLAAGEYASSIYFVPLVAYGGMPVTYREYLDYRDGLVLANLNEIKTSVPFWTDDGIWSWSMTDEKWCVELHLRSEQRVVERAPHLAGKIQRVKYEPLQHLRSPYPDSDYFKDGGVSLRNSDPTYQPWGNPIR